MDIRRIYTLVEEIRRDAGTPVEPAITRVAAIAVVENPLAGKPGADVAPLVEYGTELGRILAERCTAVIPGERIHSYGKSAIIGLHGEIEHAAALIHPTYGKSVRAVIGGGAAAIPSSKKIGMPGTPVDVPLGYRDNGSVASHFDTMSIWVPDAPKPHEFVVVLVCTDGGRPHPRTPGLKLEDVRK